jgi:2-polyprenyl-6-methoxyphenol hydroxylase-like FAD-dependent oxidoreductase
VRVYERSSGPDARGAGGTLDVHADSGQRALNAAGFSAEFRKLARPTGERMADIHGNVLMEDLPDEATGYDRPEIDRTDLNGLVRGALAPGTVAWDHNFRTLDDDGKAFRLHFEGQPDRDADVVVGASGGRSRVRPYITDVAPAFTGTVMLGGDIPDPDARCAAFAALVDKGNLMVRGEGKMLFVHTMADGAFHYYVSFRQPADWFAQHGVTAGDPAGVARFLAAQTAKWAAAYHEGFEATTAFDLLQITSVALAPSRKVPRPITLVGDAAHVMTPFAGLGVNAGLLDALHLADALTDGRALDVESAIQKYEEEMYTYAHAASVQAAQAEVFIHSDMSMEEMIGATRTGDPLS